MSKKPPVLTLEQAQKALAGPRKEFTCPFCGLGAVAYKSGAVIHVEPVCQMFRDLEPDQFLYEVNEKLGYHEKAASKVN